MRVSTHNLFTVCIFALVGSVCATIFPSTTIAQNADSFPVRGVVRALNTAAISTDLSVPIKKLHYRQGENFKKGDTLIEFDCARFFAERGILVAEQEIQYLTYKNNLTLQKHSAIGEFDVEISKGKVNKADAEISRLDVRLARCKVKAPFDGQVEETATLQYETPKPGTPFINITEVGKLEIDFIVPSKWLSWIGPGTKFSFKLDENSKTYEGLVSRLGASVDPVSQTIEIRGKFLKENKGLFAGMSGSGKFIGPGS